MSDKRKLCSDRAKTDLNWVVWVVMTCSYQRIGGAIVVT